MINKILKNNFEINLKNNILDIKNYIKIIDISNYKIEVLLDKKRLIVNGKELLIKCMDEYEIVIKGDVISIQFKDE